MSKVIFVSVALLIVIVMMEHTVEACKSDFRDVSILKNN